MYRAATRAIVACSLIGLHAVDIHILTFLGDSEQLLLTSFHNCLKQYSLDPPNTCTIRVQYYHGLLIIVLCTMHHTTDPRKTNKIWH